MILKYPEDKVKIEEIIEKSKEAPLEIIEKVRKIIEMVKNEGDNAIIKLTKEFDKIELKNLKIDEKEIEKSKIENIQSIKKAIRNISLFHKMQLRKPFRKIKKGKTITEVIRPIKRIGLYIPGGKFPLISSLLMTAIPAKIAGCSEIAIASPPIINPYILGICHILGINEVYQIGGAQAIAAFAYGTETVKRVDYIAGPGNIYVTIAKRLVFGDVGIDLLAGPSEILIIADSSCNPKFITIDLLAQREHGNDGLFVLITTSFDIAKKVEEELNNGIIIYTKNLSDASFLSNLFAPEHLCIYTRNPKAILKNIENAGAIFLGQYSPVALGDYIAGPSHVLPTSSSSRFSSGLSTASFQKRIPVISYNKKGILEDKDAIILAKIEGLIKHKESIEKRVATL